MEKQTFYYSGVSSQGQAMSGTVNAKDISDACILAKNMGIQNAKVSLNKEIYTPIGDPTRKIVGDPVSSTPPDIILPPKPTIMPLEPPAKPDAVPSMHDSHSKTAAKITQTMRGLGNDVAHFNEARQEAQQAAMVRQSLLVGEEKRILEQIEPLLAKQGGRIMSVNMVPNHHGNIMFAIVVEHYLKERK